MSKYIKAGAEINFKISNNGKVFRNISTVVNRLKILYFVMIKFHKTWLTWRHGVYTNTHLKNTYNHNNNNDNNWRKKKIRKKQRQTSFSRDAPLYHTELPPFSWYKATQQRKKHRTDVSKSKTAWGETSRRTTHNCPPCHSKKKGKKGKQRKNTSLRREVSSYHTQLPPFS